MKMLLVSLAGIGNFLMQSPVFTAIKKAHPDWHLTVWVAPRGTKELAENNPHVDAIIEAPIKESIAAHLKLIRRLKKEHFDIGIVLSPGQLIKSAAYLWLSGIPKRIGHKYPLRNNPTSSFLLTDSIDELENTHDIEQNLNLLSILRITPDSSFQIQYTLSIPESAHKEAAALLQKLSIPTNKLLVGFHMGSAKGFEWKRWPIENFIEVGKTLIQQKNVHVLLFGGPDENDLKESAQKALGEHATIISSPSLLTTAAIMQKCAFFLSNDSGLMHLTAASGIKTLGLFGPTNEHITAPRGPHSNILRAPGTHPVYDTEKNYTPSSQQHESISQIDPQTVLDKIAQII